MIHIVLYQFELSLEDVSGKMTLKPFHSKALLSSSRQNQMRQCNFEFASKLPPIHNCWYTKTKKYPTVCPIYLIEWPFFTAWKTRKTLTKTYIFFIKSYLNYQETLLKQVLAQKFQWAQILQRFKVGNRIKRKDLSLKAGIFRTSENLWLKLLWDWYLLC